MRKLMTLGIGCLLMTTAGLTGCKIEDEECVVGEMWCDGDQVMRCEDAVFSSPHLVIDRICLEGLCLEDGEGNAARCQPSEDLCAAGYQGGICMGTVAATCTADGEVVWAHDCAEPDPYSNWPTFSHCVVSTMDGVAHCAYAAETCDVEGEASCHVFQDGRDGAVICHWGVWGAPVFCEKGCVTDAEGLTTCAS